MRLRTQAVALIASLVILVVSGVFVVDYTLGSSMAYYAGEPSRTERMLRLQNFADIWLVVFIIAAVASIIFGVLVYRRRRRAQTKDLHESHVA
jgi:ABC-type Fe3+ transport system permease subunit